jgi:hypothetical protein
LVQTAILFCGVDFVSVFSIHPPKLIGWGKVLFRDLMDNAICIQK